MSNKWVDVVFVQDYSEILEVAPEIDVSDRDALAEYLTQWDFGDETDAAHTRSGEPWGAEDMLSEHVIGGLTYTLGTHRFGYVSLNRRPLED